MKSATKSDIRNFHLPLPDSLYQSLRKEAERLKRPATGLAREAIQTWLRQRHREALREAISDYAMRHAGSDVDLDEELEAAAVEHLLVEKS
jgi:hypothetical protein